MDLFRAGRTHPDPRSFTREMTISRRLEESFLRAHRPWLVKQATWRTGDPSCAEDLAQEVLVAAWERREAIVGEPSRGWLAGILRHKVSDHWRRAGRLREADPCPGGCEEDPFDETGHWNDHPASWGAPDEALVSDGFWKVLELCSRIMPPVQYRAFVLREVDDLPIEAICQELGVTSGNCHVLLHRARMRLRGCVDENWRSLR